MFSNYFWAFIISSKLLCNSDFSAIGGSEKGICEASVGKKMVD